MSGPAIFQPGDPEISRNPIFSTQQNQATGMANVPGQFAGAADALSQLVQLQQAKKDEALGKLARVHAAIDAGLYPQSIMDTPEVQALFPQAGLDALQHQQLLPKVSDQITQQKSSELSTNPIFAPGTAGSLAVTGLPEESKLNVESQVANDTQNPAVAREVAQTPAPATAENIQGAKESKSIAAGVGAKTDIKQAWFSDKAVGDAADRYKIDPQFRNFVEASRVGVLEPYVEILKQYFASQALNKQTQANGAQVITGAISNAGTHYEAEHRDWLDRQTQAVSAYRQNLILSRSDEDAEQQDQDVENYATSWRHQNPEPKYEEVLQRDVNAAAGALGLTPQQLGGVANAMAGVTTPARLESKNPRLIGSIIEQAKVNPNKIMLVDAHGVAHPGTLDQILNAKAADGSPMLTDNEKLYILNSVHGGGPKFDPNKARGGTGGNRTPVAAGGSKAPPSTSP
jgi:hypothetical protein